MWLFTKQGFYSVVKHDTDEDTFIVRARSLRHLEKLQRLAGLEHLPNVVSTPTADYPYRMYVKSSTLREIVARLADDVDYPNFKSAVAQERGESNFARTLAVIWNAMRVWQNKDSGVIHRRHALADMATLAVLHALETSIAEEPSVTVHSYVNARRIVKAALLAVFESTR